MAKAKVYAAFNPKTQEAFTFNSWSECEACVKGKPFRYRGFATLSEAKAWLESGAEYYYDPKAKQEALMKQYTELDRDAIFCDSGQISGQNTEVNVSDFNGNSLIKDIRASTSYGKFNENGYLELPKGKTNNYGELLGLYLALVYAANKDIKTIYSDSRIVLDYWSVGAYNIDDEETVKLIKDVYIMRRGYELGGGKILWVSGDVNPADLGRHKGGIASKLNKKA